MEENQFISFLIKLPLDIQSIIFNFLENKDAAHLAQTCKYFEKWSSNLFSIKFKGKGDMNYRKHSYQTACLYYTTAINFGRKTKRDPILYSNRSAANYKLRQYSSALVDATFAVRLNPKWIKGYVRMAKACEGLKQYENARICYVTSLTKAENVFPATTNWILSNIQRLEHLTKSKYNTIGKSLIDRSKHWGVFTNPDVFEWSRIGDYYKIAKWISEGNSVNVVTSSGLTPLLMAVQSLQVAVTTLLLESGAKVTKEVMEASLSSLCDRHEIEIWKRKMIRNELGKYPIVEEQFPELTRCYTVEFEENFDSILFEEEENNNNESKFTKGTYLQQQQPKSHLHHCVCQ